MSPSRRHLLLSGLAAAAIGGLSYRHWKAGTNATAISTNAIASLFSRTYPDLAGTPQALAQWRGKILVVNFWAVWCAPCREEMPAFSLLQREMRGNGVQFVGISGDSPNTAQRFAEQTGVSYPLLLAGNDTLELCRTLGNTAMALPFTLILGKHGEPLLAHTGRLPEDTLRSALQKASSDEKLDKSR